MSGHAMAACPRSTRGFDACENRRVSERMKAWISLGVIVALVTLLRW
jgi:hypothetical protein